VDRSARAKRVMVVTIEVHNPLSLSLSLCIYICIYIYMYMHECDTLDPTFYTLHPTPCTLHSTPYSLQPTPYTLHPTPNPGARAERVMVVTIEVLSALYITLQGCIAHKKHSPPRTLQ
jgi:hypothetical protein